MTFRNLWTPSSSHDNGYFHPENGYYSNAGERGDSGGYPFGPSQQSNPWQGKKAIKKQAAMSALTLIAFLFFLNILQNCLKDQMSEPTIIAMVNIDPLGVLGQSKQESSDEQQLIDKQDDINQTIHIRKLLSVEEEDENESRKGKFIQDFESDSTNWTNDLSQMTDEDLIRQKEKLENLRTLWRKQETKKKEKESMKEEVERIKVRKFVNSPILADLKEIPKLSQYSAAHRLSTPPPPTKSIEFEEPATKVADFHEFELFKEDNPVLNKQEETVLQNAANNFKSVVTEKKYPIYQYHSKYQKLYPKEESIEEIQPSNGESHEKEISNKLEEVAAKEVQHHLNFIGDGEPFNIYEAQHLRADPVGIAEVIPDPFGHDDSLNTPRYRRSEEQLTTLPTEELFRPEHVQIVTPNPATEPIPTDTKVYHAYTHPAHIHSNVWKSTTPILPTRESLTTTKKSTSTEKFTVESIFLTTARPLPHRTQPYFNNHRLQYKPATRYRYSPNRRVAYDPPLVRQEYYPMSVVGQYPGEDTEGPSFGVLSLIWTLVSSFARPISRLMPQVSKVGGEAQCFDLLACEAHRIGRYMGPTGQAIATTFSTILLWTLPEPDKPTLDAAVVAGRENSCMQQIMACDEKSGGKSAMTMVAQLMELRSDKQAREPRTRFLYNLH